MKPNSVKLIEPDISRDMVVSGELYKDGDTIYIVAKIEENYSTLISLVNGDRFRDNFDVSIISKAALALQGFRYVGNGKITIEIE